MDVPLLLKALGDPTRFAIYRRLLERKHCVRSLSKTMGITESAVSQHMKILREAGLVYGEKYGRHTHYLPSHEAADVLAEAFSAMQRRSRELCRDPARCECEFRREGERG
ncbi:MAG: winged helix-turn-helix transcriptional regulator [Oscillospiraceae bacterium]|nr:winged helix-turn-helix transcriptional regulator [Oscillospiraceae bacterium]